MRTRSIASLPLVPPWAPSFNFIITSSASHHSYPVCRRVLLVPPRRHLPQLREAERHPPGGGGRLTAAAGAGGDGGSAQGAVAAGSQAGARRTVAYGVSCQASGAPATLRFGFSHEKTLPSPSSKLSPCPRREHPGCTDKRLPAPHRTDCYGKCGIRNEPGRGGR